MKAFVVNDFKGGHGHADWGLTPPCSGEVQIRISACGLNFADLLMLQGRYQDTPEPPFVPGMEVAGLLTEVGAGVAGLTPGDRVCAFTGAGGLAEAVNVDASRCLRVPDAVSMTAAAGVLIAFGTSHLALTERARLRAGERLLVTGAGGGVGLTAVTLGARLGAEVVAVARGDDKKAAARAAGAERVLSPDDPDLGDRIKAMGGADVVYDAVGGALFRAALRGIRPGGRILCIGFASGEVPQIPANHLLVKNVDVQGFYWGGYLRFAPEVFRDSLAEVIAMLARKEIAPTIGAVLPFARTQEALEMLRARAVPGKIVVTMD